MLMDYEDKPTRVTWWRLYAKRKVLVVELRTNNTSVKVTGSHRVLTPTGVVQAKDCKVGDHVKVGYCDGSEQEKVVKIEKRNAYRQVVEIELEGDPTIEIFTRSILVKGRDPTADIGEISACKEELDSLPGAALSEAWQSDDEMK